MSVQPVSHTMASAQQKAYCVLEFSHTQSVITVQRSFRIRFRAEDFVLSHHHQRTFDGGIDSLKKPGASVKGKVLAGHALLNKQWNKSDEHLSVAPATLRAVLPENLRYHA